VSATVAVFIAVTTSACADDARVGHSAELSSTSTTGPTSSTVAPRPPISTKALGSLLAGTPAGVYDRFDEPVSNVAELRDRSAVTVVATFVDYELNPASEPAIYVPGYAGSSGVLRLLFRVEAVLGGRAPEAVEAAGHEGEGTIAVDTDYWIPADLQAEHFDQLAELDNHRFVLFLEGGAVDNVSTGAYRLWVPPWGVLAESAGELVRVWPDHELVLRRAVERGQALHPSTETTGTSTPTTSDYVYRDQLTPLEGMTIESFLSAYQVVDDARLRPPGPTIVD